MTEQKRSNGIKKRLDVSEYAHSLTDLLRVVKGIFPEFDTGAFAVEFSIFSNAIDTNILWASVRYQDPDLRDGWVNKCDKIIEALEKMKTIEALKLFFY